MTTYQRQEIPGLEVHSIIRWVWQQINDQRISQQDVAEKSGVSVSTMQKWRNGQRSPRLAELDAVVQALGYQLKTAVMEDRG